MQEHIPQFVSTEMCCPAVLLKRTSHAELELAVLVQGRVCHADDFTFVSPDRQMAKHRCCSF